MDKELAAKLDTIIGLLEELAAKKKQSRPPEIPKEHKDRAWNTYSMWFLRRYKVQPPDDATTKRQMSQFIRKVGPIDAPAIIEHYLRSNHYFYKNNTHSIGVMLKDAGKLQVEWKRSKLYGENA